MKWYSKRSEYRNNNNTSRIIGILGILFGLSVFVWSFQDISPWTLSPRAMDYCQILPMHGVEGSQPSSNLSLITLLVLARHGARNYIHTLPDTSPVQCQGTAFMDHVSLLDLSPSHPFRYTFGKHTCAPGQLSLQGIAQLQGLGTLVRNAYSTLLKGGLDPSTSYLRSTPYQRTVQSLAAFASECFAHSADTRNVQIRVHGNPADESMLGTGPRTTTSDKETGETLSQGSCPYAAKQHTRQESLFTVSDALAERIQSRFPTSSQTVTHVADSLYISACQGHQVCDSLLFDEITEQADRHFCTRFQGLSGGKHATFLSFHTFLSTVLHNIMHPGPFNFFYYSGHDTVIAPILSYLGVYDCKWPPFAARLILEVWADTVSHQRSVRVLYNGDVVSHRIPGCGIEGLCEVSIIESLVHSGLLGRSSLQEACQYGPPK